MYKKVCLGDLADIITGPFGSQLHASDYVEQGIPSIMPQDIGDRIVIHDRIAHITEQDAERLKKYRVEIGDIVYSRRGNIERCALISENDTGALCGTGCLRIRPDKMLVNAVFLSFYLSTPHIRKWIVDNATGATMPNLNSAILKKLPVELPDLKEQYRIANELQAIDDKIKNNSKLITTLESMAKTLYDYWFVQFDFPDANGRPYKTSGGKMEWNETLSREIPAGWKVRRIKDVLSVVTGKEDANFATMNGKFKFFTCSDDVLKCDIAAFDGKAVLLAGNGNFNVKHYTGKFNAYQRTYVLIPNDNNLYGVLYLSVLRMVDTLTKHSTGSIVKFITKGDVEDIKILEQPNKELYSKINVLMDKIEKLQEENERLTGIRDFLLPMLMNGQVTFRQ